MADPISMIAMGMTVAGGAVSAFGKLQEGASTAEMYKYKAAVAEQNRVYQLQAGDIAQQRAGMKERFQESQTLALQGASGLDVGRGSAPLVRQSMHDVGIQEQGIVRSDYARRAYGEEAEAQLDIAAGKQVKKAAGIGAVSSILGAGTSVADKWFLGRSVGLGTSSGLNIYGSS